VDDSALFAKSFNAALELKEVPFSLLNDLGLNIHPTKGAIRQPWRGTTSE
jgi:hypothetical protein